MKRYTSLLLLLLVSGVLFGQSKEHKTEGLKWVSFAEAMQMNVNGDKKIFIDIYTDWCGWCKKMDRSTFIDSAVVAEMNLNYIPVKLNAQQKADIIVGDTTYVFEQRGSSGYHQLAVALLNGKLKFPTCIILDEQFNMLQPLPGFHGASDLRPILAFLGGDMYKKMDFEAFQKWEATSSGKQ